ncbi:MAG: hypothetical protein ACOCZ8_03235 [Bacteroidota bacterium]
MKDFSDILTEGFPTAPKHGLYGGKDIPGSKQGRALSAYKDIPTPSAILGVCDYGNMLRGGVHAFTGTMAYTTEGEFPLEELRSVTSSERIVQLTVNAAGQSRVLQIKTESPEAAEMLTRALDRIVYAPKAADLLEEAQDYSDFDPEQIKWLELRDEIMKTIDQLHERFQLGKISLTEYENKKTDLLARL